MPVPVMFRIASLPVREMEVDLMVVVPVPVEKVLPFGIVTLPASEMPPEPLLRFSAVVPVELPMVMIFEAAPLPRLTPPVVPESRVRAPVVPVVIPIAEAAAEDNARVPVEESVVGPVPVRVEAPAARAKRVVPLVIRFKALASVVPRTAVAPKPLPFCS